MATITMNAINEAVKNALANIDANDVLYTKENKDGEVAYEVKATDVLEWFDKQASKAAKAAEKSKETAAKKRMEQNATFKDAILAVFEENEYKPMTFSDIADAVEDIPTWQKAMAVIKTFPDVFEITAGKKKKEVTVIGHTTTEE